MHRLEEESREKIIEVKIPKELEKILREGQSMMRLAEHWIDKHQYSYNHKAAVEAAKNTNEIIEKLEQFKKRGYQLDIELQELTAARDIFASTLLNPDNNNL